MSSTPSIEGKTHQVPEGISNVPSEISEAEEKTIALTIKSWDQIGALKSEIISSIMAKQASILCQRFASRDGNNRPRKRAKTDPSTGTVLGSDSGAISNVSSVVTSDEGSAVDSASESQKIEESSLENEVEADRQIDRLGRMSRLMIQLEYFHQELRHEIASIAQEVDIDS